MRFVRTVSVAAAAIAALFAPVACKYPATNTAAPSVQPAAPVAASAAGTCESAPADLLAGITQGSRDNQPMQAVAGAAWRSPDYSKVWFVAMTAKTGGKTYTGVWATDSLQAGGGLIMAVDPVASQLTQWGKASTTDAAIAPDDPGVAAAKACLTAAGHQQQGQTTAHLNVPDAATARTELAGLAVAARSHEDSYERDDFKTWDTISGHCDTRETVLKLDGTGVKVDSACKATAGSWTSPYDGKTWTKTSDVDIDHVVPLGNAWASGAWAWSASKREQFANDLTDPQLVAVTDNVNESKGDRAPDEWKPPLRSFWCTYAEAWVQVKHVWHLTVTGAEKTALGGMLDTCAKA